MIKNDIKKIQDKKKNGLNVHFSYFASEDKITSKNMASQQIALTQDKRR